MSATPLTRKAEIALNDHDVVKRVNQYSVHQVLGVGSYGTVHRASSSGQDYAIKILRRPAPERRRPTLTRPSSVPADEPARPSLSRPISVGSSRTSRGTENNSIEREFEVMSRLQHPNIVRLYELIDDPRCDQQFLVMECVRGWTLQRPVARRESIPEEDLRHWLREVYLGLEHLHIHGVAHRDVKPDNILWDPEQRRAKLTDFGTAALLSHSRDAPVGGTLGADYVRATAGSTALDCAACVCHVRSGRFVADELVGTIAFFAPEMCHVGERSAGGHSSYAADWWAYGVCLFLWLHHAPPFDAPTPLLVLQRIGSEEVAFPPPPPGAPPDAIDLLRSLLQQQPAARLTPSSLRSHPFLTASGATPMPHADERALFELRRGIVRVKAQASTFSSVGSDSDRRSSAVVSASSMPPLAAGPLEEAAGEERETSVPPPLWASIWASAPTRKCHDVVLNLCVVC